MSKTIDERVLKMEFDNQRFESNVQQSMSTLDKLNEKLKMKDSSKGLDNIDKAAQKVDLSVIASSAEKVGKKFTAMEVVAITALSNITNSAMNAGKQLVKSLSVDQISSGWNKYEQKTASVQTLVNSTGKSVEEINGYLKKLMWFSDETSYGFTDMTAALGQMTSSGGKIDKLIPLITGVANATAFAGKGATEFSRVMYNLNQSYGAGYLQLMDWKSLELAGVGSKQLKEELIKAGVELGKIKKGQVDIGNFSETLKKKWANTEVMERAFGKFSELSEKAYELVESGQYDTASEAIEALSGQFGELAERAFKSAQEAKSFTEAIDATKDAVSSGWMETFDIIFGNYDEAKELWTDLANTMWDVFAGGASDRNDVLSQWKELGGRDDLMEGLQNSWHGVAEIVQTVRDATNEVFPITSDHLLSISERFKNFTSRMTGFLSKDSGWDNLIAKVNSAGVATEDFQNALIETARAHGINIDKMIADEGSFFATLKKGWLSKDIFAETVRKFIDNADQVSTSTENMQAKLEEFQNVVNRVIRGDFDNGAKRVQKLTEAGYEYAQVQELVNKVWYGGKITLEDLSDEQLKSVGYTEDQIKILRELAEEAEKTGTPLEELIQNLDKPSGKDMIFETVSNALKGLSGVLKSISTAWKSIFSFDVGGGFIGIITAVRNLSRYLVLSDDTVDKLTRTFKGLFAVLDIVRSVMVTGVTVAFRLVGAVLSQFGLSIFDVTAYIGDALVAIRNWINEHNILKAAIEGVAKVLVTLITKLGALFKWFKELPAVKKIFDSIKLEKILEVFSKIYDKVAEFISELLKLPIVQSAIEGLKSAVEFAMNAIVDGCSRAGNALNDLLQKLKMGNGFSFNGIIDGFKKFKEGFTDNIVDFLTKQPSNIKGIRLSLWNAFGSLSETISKATGGFGDALGGLKDKFASLGTVLKNFSSKIPFGSIFSVAYLAGVVVGLKKIGDGIKNLTLLLEPFNAVKSITNGLTGVFKSISKTLEVYQATLKAQAIKQIAISIAILAGSLWLLSTIPSDKLYQSMAVLALLVGVLAGMSKIPGIEKGISGIAGIGVGVLALAFALKVLQSLDLNRIAADLFVLGTVIGLLTAAMITISMFSGKFGVKAFSGVGTILAFAVAINIIVMALKSISKIDNPQRAVNTLYGIMLGLSICMAIMSKLPPKGGIGLLAMAVSIGILTKVLESIQKVKFTPEGIIKIIGMIYLIGVLMNATSLAGANALKAGVGIIAIAAAMFVLIGVFKSLNNLKIKPNAVAGMIAMVWSIMGMMTATRLAGKEAIKAGASALMIAVAIGIMTASLIALANLVDSGKLAGATAAISIISAIFGGLIAATHLAQASVGTIVALSVAIAILTGAVVALSLIEPEKLKNATAAISILMAIFGGIIAGSKFSNLKLGPLVAMSAFVAVLGGVIIAISKLAPETAISSATAIGELMLAMAGSLAIMNNVSGSLKGSAKAVAALALMGVVVGELATILGLMSKFNVDGALEKAAALSTLLLAMSAVFGIVSLVGMLGAEAVGIGIGGFAAFVGVIMALVELFGVISAAVGYLMTEFPQLQEFLNTGIPVLEQIAKGFGSLFGNIAAGFMDALGSGIADFGTHMSEFMDNLKPFFESIDAINPDSIGKIQTLTSVIGTLAKADLASSLSSFMSGFTEMFTGTSSMEAFGERAKSFGESITKFADSISGLSDDKIESIRKAADVGKALAEFESAIPNTGGMASWFAGDNTLDVFGEKLPIFGAGLVNFASSIKGLTDEDAKNITKAAEAATSLSTLANGVPPTGGMWQWIAGNQDLDQFGSKLATFGVGLTTFSSSVKNLSKEDVEHITTTAEAAQELTKVGQAIPASGGWLQNVVGNKDLDQFGAKLPAFGAGVSSFVDSVRGLTEEDTAKIDLAATATEKLGAVAEKLGTEGGWKGAVFGDSALPVYADNLKNFGNGLVSFANSAAQLDEGKLEAIEKSKKAIEKVSQAIGNLKNDLVSDQSLGYMATYLSGFGTAIIEYADKVSGLDQTKIESIEHSKTAVGKISEIFKDFKMEGPLASTFDGATYGTNLTNLGEAIVKFAEKLGTFGGSELETIKNGSQAVKEFATQFKDMPSMTELTGKMTGTGDANFADKLTEFGEGLVAFKTSVEDLKQGDTKQITVIANHIKSAIDSIPSSTEISAKFSGNAGLSTVATAIKDFIAQIKEITPDSVSSVSETLKSIGEAVNGSMSSIGDSFEALGGTIDTGIAEGIQNSADQVTTAANSVVNNAANAASSIASSAFMASGVNAVLGLAAGIVATTPVAVAAAVSLANQVSAALASANQEGSPSKVYAKHGMWAVLGYAKGITDHVKDAEKASVSVATATIRSMQDYLQIGSPSRLAKDEVGRWIVQGIAEGISEDMSAEEAAEKKAENIISAFQRVIERADLKKSGAEIALKLWEALNPNASPEERMYKRYESLDQQAKFFDERIALLQDELRNMEDNGLTDTNKYLETQNELTEAYITQKEIADDIAKVASDRYDEEVESLKLNKEIADANNRYWEATARGTLPMTEKWNQELKNAADNSSFLVNTATELEKKYTSLRDEFGEESKVAKEAYIEWMNARNDAAEDTSMSDLVDKFRSEVSEKQKMLDEAYQKTQEADEKSISKTEKDLNTLSYLTQSLRNDIDDATLAQLKYLDAVKKYGENSTQAYKALTEAVNANRKATSRIDTIDSTLYKGAYEFNKARNEYYSFIQKNQGKAEWADLETLKAGAKSHVYELFGISNFDPEHNPFTEASTTIQNEIIKPYKELTEDGTISKIFGMDTMQAAADGITDAIPVLKDAGTEALNRLLEIAKQSNSDFYNAGREMIVGLMAGFKDGVDGVVTAASGVGEASVAAIEDTLEINSPSKRFYRIAAYADKGFANGLVDFAYMVDNATNRVSNSAISLMEETIDLIAQNVNEDMDLTPTIRPVMDISGVKKASGSIHDMIGYKAKISLNGTSGIAEAAYASAMPEAKEGINVQTGATTYQFTQNNYSPKALSQIDIYRQSKTLFASFERTARA